MIDIDSLTIREAKEISTLLGVGTSQNAPPHPWEIGANYLIRTVTMIQTGRLVAVYGQELVLEEAAWIADTGRFSDSLASCEFNEVEPFPDGKVVIGRGSVIDAVKIPRLVRARK